MVRCAQYFSAFDKLSSSLNASLMDFANMFPHDLRGWGVVQGIQSGPVGCVE